MIDIEGKIHLCRARCEDCVDEYLQRRRNKLKCYYVSPQYVPEELMCTNHCHEPKHSGLIVSEDALKLGYGLFAHGPVWKLTEEQINAARNNPL